MAWDFETEPEFETKLEWIRQFARRGRAARPDLPAPLVPPARRRPRPVYVRPLQEEVKARGLWAAHLGPELGGMGFGQLKLALINEILGRSSWAPIVFGLPGARLRQRRDHRPLRHRGAEGEVPAAAARRRVLLVLLDDRAAGRRRPEDVHAPRVKDGDEWVINGEQVLLVERPHVAVHHRDGGHRSRRAVLPGHVDVPGPHRHARPRHRAPHRAHRPSREDEGMHALHPLQRRAASRPRTCSAARARRSRSRRPASAAAACHHAMRTVGVCSRPST